MIGGGFDAIGGHNPWEAAQLGTAILHGPDTHNFRDDYARLHTVGAAHEVAPGALAAALTDEQAITSMVNAATSEAAAAQGALGPLAATLLDLMRRKT